MTRRTFYLGLTTIGMCTMGIFALLYAVASPYMKAGF